jgi:hypothetical protein
MPDHLTEFYDLEIREIRNEAGKLVKALLRFMPKHPTWKVAVYRDDGSVEYRTIISFGINSPVDPNGAGDVGWDDCAVIDPSCGQFFHLGSMGVYCDEAAFVDGMRDWKREQELMRKRNPSELPS